MNKLAAQPDVLVARMASLADPTRLRLLRLLESHELGVVDLCQVLQMPQSTVSRHLKVLSDQGWTTSRRHGTTNLYDMTVDELEPAAGRLWDLARRQTDGWATLAQDQLRLQERLRKYSRDAQAFFAGAAADWDQLRHQLYGQTFARAAYAALLPSSWIVADLGCGTGRTATELAGHVQRVIAVDNSPAMLKAARKRLKGIDNVDVRRGDLLDLPIDDGSCDAAIALLVLTYLEDVPKVLSEAARVVRSGGSFVMVDLLQHDREDFRRQMGQEHMGFDPDTLRSRMLDAGFRSAAVSALPPEADAKGPALVLAKAVK